MRSAQDFFCPHSCGLFFCLLFLRYIVRMYKTSCVAVFTVLALWSWAVQAVVVPQPVGMYITPVQDYFESDIVTVDSGALLAHEGQIRDVMAAQVDLGAYHSTLAERWLELAHEGEVLSLLSFLLLELTP